MNTKNPRYNLFFVVALLLATCYMLRANMASAFSAKIYFGPADTQVVAGREFSIPVLVSSDQPLNAYSLSVNYDPRTLELKGLDRSRSVADISQGEPEISTIGAIRFKGGSTAPFVGMDGELFTVRFKALQEGQIKLSFAQAIFYLANGKGTKVVPQSVNTDLSAASSTTTVPEPDNAINPVSVPAKIRFLSFVNDPLNPDQKFLSFDVQDAGSGIKGVSYRSRTLLWWSDPMPAVNPMALSKDVWAASLEVTDGSGNKTETTIYDWGAIFYNPAAIAAFAVIIAAAVIYASRKRKSV